MPILSVGEILWDVFPDAEHLGGAPLNFAAALQRLGDRVVLATAVGADARGERALQRMRALGLSTELVQVAPGQATGTALVSKDPSGNASFVLPRPAAYDALAVDEALLSRLCLRSWDWIYFGTLAQTPASQEQQLQRLLARIPGVRGFYDMNLRAGHWNLELVQRLSALAAVIKLNESEAAALWDRRGGVEEFSLERFCRYWAAAYKVEVMCVTLGEQGCAVLADDEFQTAAGFPSAAVDTVGAGDAFAAALLYGLQRRWPLPRTAAFANALGAIVAGRAGAIPEWSAAELEGLAARGASAKMR